MRCRRLRPHRAALLALAGLPAACGGGDDLAAERAEQVRQVAEEAGLPDDVADVLELAARGTTATFQITYAGEAGAQLIVSQDPPNRRVDVVSGERIVESRVLRDGVGYRCAVPDGQPDGDLRCTRSEGAVAAPGAFTDEALDAFASELAESSGSLELEVEERQLAGVTATCLVARPGGTGSGGADAETICLSPEGGQLLVDSGGERVEAEAYTTEVPTGTFDV